VAWNLFPELQPVRQQLQAVYGTDYKGELNLKSHAAVPGGKTGSKIRPQVPRDLWLVSTSREHAPGIPGPMAPALLPFSLAEMTGGT
jgi:hypothetical protein